MVSPHFVCFKSILKKKGVGNMLEVGKLKRVLPIACALLVGLSLGGCRESEQGRVQEFQKGTYLGKPDQKLTDKQVNELRLRARNQRI